MKLSLFMVPRHNPSRPFHQALTEDTDAFLLACELGFHESWCGEHFSCATEAITSPLMFFSNILHRTKQIRSRTGVAGLPQHHPAVYAGHAALFDHLSKGQFIFGIRLGGLQPDMDVFGTMDRDRTAMLRESIDTILQIWTTDPAYDIQGAQRTTRIKDWTIDELGLGQFVHPYQVRHPPIAIAGSSPNSGSMKGAGRRGWIAVTANFIGAWAAKTPWQVAAHAAGRNPGHDICRVARSIYVADTDTDAEAEKFVRAKDSPWGSPATVVRKLLDFREEIGDFGHRLLTGHDWTDPPRMRATMRRMAHEVMPLVNKAIGASQDDPLLAWAA